MDVSKFFVASMAVLLLAGCGQVGPLYPAAQQSKTIHKYDQFLLQSSTPSEVTPVNTEANPIVLPDPFPQLKQP